MRPHAGEEHAMRIMFAPEIEANSALHGAITARSRLLESVIDGSAEVARWSEGKDWSGRPAVFLQLVDPSGTRVKAELLPSEFSNEQKLGERLRGLRAAMSQVHHWRFAVDTFFTKLRAWCERLPEVQLGGVTYPVLVKGGTVRVTEAASGEYEIGQLEVRRSASMRISPVAAWVVGWDGRVDMIGPGDRFILHYRRSEDAWYHVPNALPYHEFLLTEGLFHELAEVCLDEQPA